MPTDMVSTRTGRPGALQTPSEGRGHPRLVTLRRTTALASVMEGIALADEVIAGAERIVTAAAAGSRQHLANEAGRLGYRANGYRSRFRAMAAELEE